MTIQKVDKTDGVKRIKIMKANPVAKAMQNKRFHEKVKSPINEYNRAKNKKISRQDFYMDEY